MRTTTAFLALWIIGIVLSAERPDGLWLLSRMDSANWARADVSGRMKTAPGEIWRTTTGADIRYAAPVTIDNREAFLVHAGRTLALMRPDGKERWRLDRDSVRQVVRIDDFDGDLRKEVLIFRGNRDISLLDLKSGSILWNWMSPPSSNNILCRFMKTGKGIRLITFPNYSCLGICFDFSGASKNPRRVWEKDFSDKYTKGYGPSFFLADMDGDGTSEILLSSKRENHPEEKSLYQAVIDPDSGKIKYEGYVRPDATAPLPLGRPYGFLQSADLDNDGRQEVVLVSCQVEEYLAVTRLTKEGAIEKIWSRFIEKDWPIDDRELRPQVTSLADVDGDGRLELVIGLWNGGCWSTITLDPLKGYDFPKSRREGYYFWGCHDLDGDGTAEIICSLENRRRPGRVAKLAAISGRTGRTVAELDDASIFTSADSDLGEGLYFMAVRSNPVFLSAASHRNGLLVRKFANGREEGIFLWGAMADGSICPQKISEPGFNRLDWHDGHLLLSTSRGVIRKFDDRLSPAGNPIQAAGKLATPLVWKMGNRREIVFEEAGGSVSGGTPDFSRSGKWKSHWTVSGAMPSLHIDRNGTGRLCASETADPDHPGVLIYEAPIACSGSPLRIPLEFPPFIGLLPFGKEFRLLIDLQTGVHTNAFACYNSRGERIWKDSGHGAYPRLPAAGDLDGDDVFEVAADDHGEIRILDSAGSLVGSNIKKSWAPPAYLMPILGPFLPDGRIGVLGISGFGGMALLDASGVVQWKKTGGDWEYYRSLGAIGYTGSSNRPELGVLTETGMFQCLEPSTGRVIWTMNLHAPIEEASVVSGDLDGDGTDEYLTGLPDGRLVCLKERGKIGFIEWEKQLDAAIGPLAIADADGGGRAEILLGTANGQIRILK
jgi:outer membrane protein assembly factor BamB